MLRATVWSGATYPLHPAPCWMHTPCYKAPWNKPTGPRGEAPSSSSPAKLGLPCPCLAHSTRHGSCGVAGNNGEFAHPPQKHPPKAASRSCRSARKTWACRPQDSSCGRPNRTCPALPLERVAEHASAHAQARLGQQATRPTSCFVANNELLLPRPCFRALPGLAVACRGPCPRPRPPRTCRTGPPPPGPARQLGRAGAAGAWQSQWTSLRRARR
mmetsp:Transcript_42410/g.122689  ORF Transcript_42410/g.122689 Transcript_42410/m.122689 type:complete len:215 (-) Transcript_42410:96-740(-)